MIHIGDVILPDGRIVHGEVKATYEHDTNSVDVYEVKLSWPDGNELTEDEYNEDLGGVYLHEFATDELLLTRGELKDCL